jgi:hypothetical protein
MSKIRRLLVVLLASPFVLITCAVSPYIVYVIAGGGSDEPTTVLWAAWAAVAIPALLFVTAAVSAAYWVLRAPPAEMGRPEQEHRPRQMTVGSRRDADLYVKLGWTLIRASDSRPPEYVLEWQALGEPAKPFIR